MPLFNSQIHWPEIGATVAVALLTVLTLAFAVVSYVEWSSNTALAESMSEASVSDPNHSNESPAPIQSLKGRTGCPQGKRSLPTELTPLP